MGDPPPLPVSRWRSGLGKILGMKRTPAVAAYLAWLGKRGGQARKAALSPTKRKEAAREAARARWAAISVQDRKAHAKALARMRWGKPKATK